MMARIIQVRLSTICISIFYDHIIRLRCDPLPPLARAKESVNLKRTGNRIRRGIKLRIVDILCAPR